MRFICRAVAAAIAAFAIPAVIPAAIVEKELTVSTGGVTLKAVFVYDDATTPPRPGVIVVPEWWGLDAYPRKRARQIAELGYAAMAIDMYGDGKVTTDPAVAGKWAGEVKGNPDIARARTRAAYETLSKLPGVDSTRIAAIGYCFGGAMVLEMARDGVPVKGVVSFHGSLSTPKPAGKGAVKAKVLVCHGEDDPMVGKDEVAAFKKEMEEAGATLLFRSYAGAVHSFTNPAADSHGIEGVAYNADADKQSWKDMKGFLADVFGTR